MPKVNIKRKIIEFKDQLKELKIGQSISEVVTATLSLLALAVAVAGSLIAISQIEESSIQAWESHLDSRGFEISKILVESETLGCVYSYEEDLHDWCERSIFGSSEKLLQSLAYAEMVVEYLMESRKFSDTSQEEYSEWNARWIESIKEDSLGIFAKVVRDYFVKSSAENQNSEDIKILERALFQNDKQAAALLKEFMKGSSKYVTSLKKHEEKRRQDPD